MVEGQTLLPRSRAMTIFEKTWTSADIKTAETTTVNSPQTASSPPCVSLILFLRRASWSAGPCDRKAPEGDPQRVWVWDRIGVCHPWSSAGPSAPAIVPSSAAATSGRPGRPSPGAGRHPCHPILLLKRAFLTVVFWQQTHETHETRAAVAVAPCQEGRPSPVANPVACRESTSIDVINR